MTCAETYPLLADLAARLLPPEKEDEVDGHLETCARCRHLMAEQLALCLQATASVEEAGVLVSLRSSLLGVEHRRARTAAAMLLAAASLLLGIWLGGRGDDRQLTTLGGVPTIPDALQRPLVVTWMRQADQVGRLVGGLPPEADLLVETDADDVYVVSQGRALRLGREGRFWVWAAPGLGDGTALVIALRTTSTVLDPSDLTAVDVEERLARGGHPATLVTVRGMP